jgi:uncharacterized protein
MNFSNSFEVAAPIDRVWETMLDVERVAPAVPGAQVLEKTGDDAYKVGIKVKLGPMTMQYRGDMEIVERDDAAHRAVMRVRAKEARGQGTADASSTMELRGEDGRTAATIATEVRLSGRAASMGRGIVEDVSRRLVDQFAENLAEMVEGGGGDKPPADKGPTYEAPPADKAPTYEAPKREDSLDVGALAGDLAAARLQDKRVLFGALALAALLGYLVGRRS